MSYLWFMLAAAAEIAGCYTFWMWLRLERSPLWLAPGALSLVVFALLLTRAEAHYAGRAFAAYGGVYIVASLVWLLWVEGTRPSTADMGGAALCLAGAGIILFAQS